MFSASDDGYEAARNQTQYLGVSVQVYWSRGGAPLIWRCFCCTTRPCCANKTAEKRLNEAGFGLSSARFGVNRYVRMWNAEDAKAIKSNNSRDAGSAWGGLALVGL
eukprot:1779148-Rhodomonas_salina.1